LKASKARQRVGRIEVGRTISLDGARSRRTGHERWQVARHEAPERIHRETTEVSSVAGGGKETLDGRRRRSIDLGE
jgi:hypothetical protein